MGSSKRNADVLMVTLWTVGFLRVTSSFAGSGGAKAVTLQMLSVKELFDINGENKSPFLESTSYSCI